MRKEIHPKYKELRVIVGSGDVFITNSTIAALEVLMDIDYRKHPAWTKDKSNVVNQSNQNVSNFNKKFSGLSFGASKGS